MSSPNGTVYRVKISDNGVLHGENFVRTVTACYDADDRSFSIYDIVDGVFLAAIYNDTQK